MRVLVVLAFSAFLIVSQGAKANEINICDNGRPSAKVITHVYPKSIISRIDPDIEEIIKKSSAVVFPKQIWIGLFGKVCSSRQAPEIFSDFRPRIVIYENDFSKDRVIALEYPDHDDFSPVRGVIGNKQILVDNSLVRKLLDDTRLK